jgi:hypothetical protein
MQDSEKQTKSNKTGGISQEYLPSEHPQYNQENKKLHYI